jgi:hypothetical protein
MRSVYSSAARRKLLDPRVFPSIGLLQLFRTASEFLLLDFSAVAESHAYLTVHNGSTEAERLNIVPHSYQSAVSWMRNFAERGP